MANLILSIGFTEANGPKAIKYLCGLYGLDETEANAKAALKRHTAEGMRQEAVETSRKAIEAAPLPE